MNKQIVFLAGVHGVGKSTFCEALKDRLNLPGYSASTLIKKYNASLDFPDKKITKIQTNQDALICSIEESVNEMKFILDGHFVLLNKNGEIEKVPIETFVNLNPIYILLLTEKPQIIHDRLEARGPNSLSLDLINELQEREIAYAQEISQLLNVKLHRLDSEEQRNNYLKIGGN